MSGPLSATDWLEGERTRWRETTPPSVDDLIDRLAATPRRLGAATAGRRAGELTSRPQPDAWSAQEVIAHLRAADDIVSPRLLMILTRDGVPLASLDERRWAEVAGYGAMDVRSSLEAFALRRDELVGALRRASPSDWRRAGVHEVRGRMSLLDVARSLAEHEEEHCRQIEGLLGRLGTRP